MHQIRLLFLCLFILTLSINTASAQDSLKKTLERPNLKTGLYLSNPDFFARKPTIEKSFTVVPLIKVKDEGDSVIYGYNYRLDDSSPNIKSVRGFYDGQYLYRQLARNAYERLYGTGRYPYSVDTFKKIFSGAGLLSMGAALLDRAVSKPQEYVFFYNKKRNYIEATTVAIAFLLEDDKDLMQEFHKEKVKNTEVFKKYLIKMNERYPK